MAESLGDDDELCEELSVALRSAVRAGIVDDVEFYIEAGARMDDDNVVYAAAHGHLGVVTTLVQHGADVNAKSDADDGMTALMCAAQSSHVDVVTELIRLGADMNLVDNHGMTATLRTLALQQLDVMAELVRLGADVNVKDRFGRTALASAVMMGSKAAVDVLIQPSIFDDSSCPTSDEVALFAAAVMGDVDSLCELVAKGVNVECVERDGRTALFYAAEYGQLSAVQHLLKCGADVATRSRTFETPPTLAGRAGHMPTLQALVQAGAPVNVRSNVDGETPLISVARFDFFPAVQLLIAHGGDALAIKDVRDDEYPLVLGSLETLTALCAATAFEFDSVCSRMLKQLQCVYCQLQQRHARQHDAAPEAALVCHDAVVTFASILFRASRVLFGIEKKSLVLSRFIASRVIMERIRDIQDELSHFADMLHLEQDEAFVGNQPQQQADEDELHQRFEQALRTDDALKDGCDFTGGDEDDDSDDDEDYSRDDFAVLLQYELAGDSDDDIPDKDDVHDRRYELALLLQYELVARQREQNVRAQAVIRRVLQRFLRACKMAKAPVVPPWFISPDDLECYIWNAENLIRHRVRFNGKWRSTNVVIEITMADPEDFKAAVAQWYPLSHPNVVKLYGACHVGTNKAFVNEAVPEAVLLLDFLRDEANQKLTWPSLYQAALGLQYLHDRGVVHGHQLNEAIVIGSDQVAKLSNIVGIWWEPSGDEMKWFPFEHDQNGLVMSDMSPAADIYSLGLCIWAVLVGELTDQDAERFICGESPARPSRMTESEYDLILRMCAHDPSDRVDIAFVVNRLKQFAVESEQFVGGSASTFAKIQSQHLDEHEFPELGSHSIPSALVHVMTRCEDFPDTQWILTSVLPALEFAFGLLQEREKTPVDTEVVAFCAAVARLQRYVAVKLSNKSVYQQMRSRKVAESHHLVYTELDQLLDMLDVEATDAIRVWRHEAAPSILNPVDLSDVPVEGVTPDTTKKASNSPSDAITLNHLDTPPAMYEQWTRDGLLKTPSSSPSSTVPERPSWYLSLKQLAFSESDKIGQGAFGAVYRGSWRGTPVVIKFMGFEEDIETISTDLLLHEVRVWHRLSHPHVLKFFGASHVDKRYFVCELAGNGELRAYLKKMREQEPGNEALVWEKLHEAALGLQYLHSMNVAHNDLKCDNIMVGLDNKAKLIDFGLSCLLDEAEVQINVKRIGAVNWRSPEYLAGKRPSRASDVYSFAMCIIEAMSGEPPWGPNPVQAGQVRFWQRRGMSPPLPDSMTPKQRNLIELMTKFEPSERVSMAFVVNKLHEIAQDASAASVSAAP